jgi:FxsC-like protein
MGSVERARGAASPVIRPYFFLSYARTPKRDQSDKENPDRWVYKLYRDLCDEILQMTAVLAPEAGFMDTENKLGAEWSPELMAAIKNCRVFVPLYSRRYFESENCGREWFAFARREVNHRARSGERVEAIVPALWTRIDHDAIPAIAQTLQYDHPDMGQRYRADGFYGIMKLRNYRDEYKKAVHRLAERIIELGDKSVAHADHAVQQWASKDFEAQLSAFGPASARRTGDGKLRISVLAHDTSSLPPGRASKYYGDTPRSWTPYKEHSSQPVAEYALELAKRCLDCDPVVEVFQVDALSGDWGPPGICLVDAWVVLSDAHHERLRQLNELPTSWLSVVVPWNTDDPDLNAQAGLLRAKLKEHLGRKLSSVPRRCRMAADGIPTIEDLGLVLPEMAMIMLKRYNKDPSALPTAGPVAPRPRLREAHPSDLGGLE